MKIETLETFLMFPLIQLPRKSEDFDDCIVVVVSEPKGFPLIQLPRKSEAERTIKSTLNSYVSINSTSEEVRRVGF